MLSRLLARCAVPCLIVVALSACGGYGSTTAAPPAAATTPSAAAAAPAATTAPTVASAATAPTAASAATSAATAAGTAAPGTTTAASGAAVSFKADVMPIFAASCTGCHGANGGLSLATYADVMKGGKDGAVIKTGDAQSSLLIQKVKGTQTIGARMPRGGPPLSDAQIQKIADWVAQGAKDN